MRCGAGDALTHGRAAAAHQLAPPTALPSRALPCPPLQYTFTVTPLNGGPALVFNSTTPTNVNFTGLTPATQYEVSVVGTRPNGSITPPSNTLNFVTPAAG